MKKFIAGLLMLSSFAASANSESVIVSIYKRCEYCTSLAQVGVKAYASLQDYSDYSLVAQNTTNVYRWHNKEALKTLWSLDFGLYVCAGDFSLEEGDQQKNFFVNKVTSCRETTPEEAETFNNRSRSGGHYGI